VIWFGDLVTGTPAKCLPKTALIFTFLNPILQNVIGTSRVPPP
jgi:hypothetical protein